VRDLDVRPGDRILLCSDGLTDFVPEDLIGGELETADPDDAAEALVGLALAAGGRDNVTCLVSDLGDGPQMRSDGRLLGAMTDPGLVVDPAAIHHDRPVRERTS
jgi:PPM family protein phosphatase